VALAVLNTGTCSSYKKKGCNRGVLYIQLFIVLHLKGQFKKYIQARYYSLPRPQYSQGKTTVKGLVTEEHFF
jgi:hypothetical protein